MSAIATKVEFDYSKYDEMLNRLSGKEMNNLIKKTLSSASRVLVNQTKKNLRDVTSRANKTASVRSQKKGWGAIKRKGQLVGYRTMEQAIRAKYHKSEDDMSMWVNIMADQRLVWEEKGTQERYTGVQRANRNSKKVWSTIIDKNGLRTSRWKFSERKAGGARMRRGKISPTHFFAKARQSTVNEQQQKMEETFARQIKILAYAKGI